MQLEIARNFAEIRNEKHQEAVSQLARALASRFNTVLLGKRILLTVASGTLVLMTLGPASGLLGAGSQVSQPPIGVCGGPHVPSVAHRAPAPAPGRIEDRDEVAGCA
jgi:hypothetical protein